MNALRASNCKNLQPKCRPQQEMDKVVIEDYDHMTTTDESANWMKPPHLILSIFPLNLMTLLYNYLYFKILDNLFKSTH